MQNKAAAPSPNERDNEIDGPNGLGDGLTDSWKADENFSSH